MQEICCFITFFGLLLKIVEFHVSIIGTAVCIGIGIDFELVRGIGIGIGFGKVVLVMSGANLVMIQCTGLNDILVPAKT